MGPPRYRSLARRRTRLSSLTVLSFTCLAIAKPTCYTITGKPYATATPCDDTATGTNGSHSACCHRLGTQDACMDSGMCFATWAMDPQIMMWSVGCTDPTGQDPACPSICRGRGGGDQFSLVPCGGASWCCWSQPLDATSPVNVAECCEKKFNPGKFGFGLVSRQFLNSGLDNATLGTDSGPGPGSGSDCTSAPTETVTVAPESTPNNGIPAAPIVGGILGGLLLASLAAAGFLFYKLRKLQRLYPMTPTPSRIGIASSRSPTTTMTTPSTASAYHRGDHRRGWSPHGSTNMNMMNVVQNAQIHEVSATPRPGELPGQPWDK